eukprot:1015828-Amphidinium_carterae.1
MAITADLSKESAAFSPSAHIRWPYGQLTIGGRQPAQINSASLQFKAHKLSLLVCSSRTT